LIHDRGAARTLRRGTVGASRRLSGTVISFPTSFLATWPGRGSLLAGGGSALIASPPWGSDQAACYECGGRSFRAPGVFGNRIHPRRAGHPALAPPLAHSLRRFFSPFVPLCLRAFHSTETTKRIQTWASRAREARFSEAGLSRRAKPAPRATAPLRSRLGRLRLVLPFQSPLTPRCFIPPAASARRRPPRTCPRRFR